MSECGSLRRPYREAGAAPRRRGHLDGPAVVLRGAVADAEPEPGAFADRLGGEERIEDPPADLGVDPLAVVDHVDGDAARLAGGPNRHAPAIRTRINRVGDQVEDRLIDLRCLAIHRGQTAELERDRDVPLGRPTAHDVDGGGYARVQIRIVPLALVQTREPAEVVHDLLDAAEALAGPDHQPLEAVQRVIDVDPLGGGVETALQIGPASAGGRLRLPVEMEQLAQDRKSTRLNSSHS